MSVGMKSSEFVVVILVILGVFTMTYLGKELTDRNFALLVAAMGAYGIERYKLKKTLNANEKGKDETDTVRKAGSGK